MAKSKKIKECPGVRHPTEKKGSDPTDPPSLISCGKRELALLRYIHSLGLDRFNIRKYARDYHTPRSTIYDMLSRLQIKGYMIKEHAGHYMITDKGISLVHDEKQGVGAFRRECRTDRKNLSTHYLRYMLNITNKKNFKEEKIKELNPIDTNKLKLPNLEQDYIYFPDATIIINPNQVAIRIHDTITDDTEEAHFETFGKALNYVKLLEKIGIQTDSIRLEDSHYARIRSILSDTLYRVDDRYFLDLGDGKKFWIDHSDDKREDETNDATVREKIDQLIRDVSGSDSTFKDIDKLKEVVGGLVKIEALKLQNSLEMLEMKPAGRPDYFG